MRAFIALSVLTASLAVTGWTTVAAQDLSFREMRWQDIGPTRAGGAGARPARALAQAKPVMAQWTAVQAKVKALK